MLNGLALKFFLVVVFYADDLETLHYFGPFETEDACYSFDYLAKSGVLYMGTCKRMDTALVPSRPT